MAGLEVLAERKLEDDRLFEKRLVSELKKEEEELGGSTEKFVTAAYRAQLEAFSKVSVIRGAFFWMLRMGSGWDPRPTDDHPKGRQLHGTSASHSADGYPFQVWSLLEMARLGVATALDDTYDGTCAALP